MGEESFDDSAAKENTSEGNTREDKEDDNELAETAHW